MDYARSERGRMEPGPSYYWGQDQPDPNQLLIAELLAREAEQERGGYYSPSQTQLDTLETPVDMEELEGLLSDEEEGAAGDTAKRIIPFQLGGPIKNKREYDPSSTRPEKREAMSDLEVDKMLSEGSEETGEVNGKEEPIGENETPATDEELQIALGDDGEEEKNVDGEIVGEKEKNKEFLQAPVPPSDFMSRKKKRSGREMSEISFDHAPEQAEIARAYIKKFLELEDDENANLANALNYATLSQVQKSDKYVKPEADFIKKAIEDEEQIQELKASLRAPGSSDEDDEPELVETEEDVEIESPPLLRKRMYPEEMEEVLEEEEVPDEELEEEGEEEEAGDDELAEAELRAFLSAKLRQFLLRTPTNAENEVSLPDDMGEWYDRPVDEMEEGVSVKGIACQFTAKLQFLWNLFAGERLPAGQHWFS